MPGNLPQLNRTSNNTVLYCDLIYIFYCINNPLFRFLEREVTVASKFLNLVKGNLQDVKSLCEGNTSSTNLTKALAKELYAD